MIADFVRDTTLNNQLFEENAIKYKQFDTCIFINCDFSKCNFQSVSFIDCTFIGCNFREAKINYVSLRDVEFKQCDFTSVNFAMTDQVIYSFHFTDCTLDYTQFYKLKLKQIRFQSQKFLVVLIVF